MIEHAREHAERQCWLRERISEFPETTTGNVRKKGNFQNLFQFSIFSVTSLTANSFILFTRRPHHVGTTNNGRERLGRSVQHSLGVNLAVLHGRFFFCRCIPAITPLAPGAPGFLECSFASLINATHSPNVVRPLRPSHSRC